MNKNNELQDVQEKLCFSQEFSKFCDLSPASPKMARLFSDVHLDFLQGCREWDAMNWEEHNFSCSPCIKDSPQGFQ